MHARAPAPRSPGLLSLQMLLKLRSSQSLSMKDWLEFSGSKHMLVGAGHPRRLGRGGLWVSCFLVPMRGDALAVRKTCRRAEH